MVIKIAKTLKYKEVIELDKLYFDWPWDNAGWKIVKKDEFLVKSAEINDQIVGFIVFQNCFDCAHLLKILVHPDFRGLGVAQKLLEESIISLKIWTVNSIYLEVAERNSAAISFYEKNGFKKLVLKPKFYKDGTAAWSMDRVIN